MKVSVPEAVLELLFKTEEAFVLLPDSIIGHVPQFGRTVGEMTQNYLLLRPELSVKVNHTNTPYSYRS